MKPVDKKNLARSLFLGGTLNRKQIAAQVGCTEKSLRRWIDQEDWEALKEATSITKGELLKDAYKQLKAINKVIEEEHHVEIVSP